MQVKIDVGVFVVGEPDKNGWCLVTTDTQPIPLGLVRMEKDEDEHDTSIPGTDEFVGWKGSEPRGATLANVFAEWRRQASVAT